MSLIKLANALTEHWADLSKASKILAGKAGMVRSDRKSIIGSITHNNVLRKQLEDKGIKIHYMTSKKIFPQPGGMPLDKKNAALVNLKNPHETLSNYLSNVGLDSKILGKETSHQGRFVNSQFHRHELREIIHGMKNMEKSSDPKQMAKATKLTTAFIKKDSLGPKHVAKFGQRVQKYNKVIQELDDRKFLGHHSKSIPLNDIRESKLAPGNLGLPMLRIRKLEHPYPTLPKNIE